MGFGVGLLSDSDGKSEIFEVCWIIKAVCRVDWRILWANNNESFADWSFWQSLKPVS
jgi:hypothetical protein